MASNITTLVEKAKQGDADAFSTLYQMYYPKIPQFGIKEKG